VILADGTRLALDLDDEGQRRLLGAHVEAAPGGLAADARVRLPPGVPQLTGTQYT